MIYKNNTDGIVCHWKAAFREPQIQNRNKEQVFHFAILFAMFRKESRKASIPIKRIISMHRRL